MTDNNNTERMTEAELVNVLNDVVQINLDPEPRETNKKIKDIEFLFKDGRTLKSWATTREVVNLVEYVRGHEKPKGKIKFSLMGSAHKGLE